MELQDDGTSVLVRGQRYELVFGEATVWLRLDGRPVAELALDGAADADGQRDLPGRVESPTLVGRNGEVRLAVRGRSALWPERTWHFAARPDGFACWVELRGRGRLDTVQFFRGWRRDGLPRASEPHFDWLWNPEPTAAGRQRFAPGERSTIGVGSDRSYERGNWFFTPGPFCYALDAGGRWLGIGLQAGPGQRQFAELEHPAGGFGFVLHYDGQEVVDGAWESPRLEFRPADGPYAAVADYATGLRARGLAPLGSGVAPADWWREPIFCGWGEQVSRAISPVDAVGGGTRRAVELSTQANYKSWLTVLTARGVDPGTVVIDDKWQRTYGSLEPDPERWPDLAGFIAAQHARGRRVLLWWKAWDPEGLPAEWCVRDETGRAVAADPTHPEYEAHLRREVRRALGEYGADGLKVDFTHLAPRGRGLRTAGGAWGVELLHRLLAILHDAAHTTKRDAMVMAHAANPWFADVVDVLRLNGVPETPPGGSYLEAMRHRARVARAAGPWLIDADNWPSPDRASWLEYLRAQPELGIPALYFATRIAWKTGDALLVDEPLRAEDYQTIAAVWAAYRSGWAGARAQKAG